MNTQQTPLLDLIHSQQAEIEKHKWIESEKVGRDIGWEQATREWMNRHFAQWKSYCWREAVRDALGLL